MPRMITIAIFDLENTGSLQKNAMAERYTITPYLRDRKEAAGAIVSQDESECIMIGEEDHLRIQATALEMPSAVSIRRLTGWMTN